MQANRMMQWKGITWAGRHVEAGRGARDEGRDVGKSGESWWPPAGRSVPMRVCDGVERV